jgi:hypothetical protein
MVCIQVKCHIVCSTERKGEALWKSQLTLILQGHTFETTQVEEVILIAEERRLPTGEEKTVVPGVGVQGGAETS